MKVFKKSKEVSEHIRSLKEQGKSIGFTPTMGALHQGHFSLIARSKERNDISICSIFVNPTQFNEATDLDKYPRQLEADTSALKQIDCDILFAPTPKEIYPDGSNYQVFVDLEGLDKMMEGAKRPGHFEGVIQVVKRLIEITACDRIYMGQKDFQQFTIINKMIQNLRIETELVVCDILRETDGLAMSSRNTRLLSDHRKKASIIYRVLMQAVEWLNENHSIEDIKRRAFQYLNIPEFKPEYFDIIDGHTLREIKSSSDHDLVVACTAVWAGEVRLIDNMILKGTI